MELDSYLSEKQKKRKKRRRFAYSIFICAIICAILIGGAWLVFKSPLFHITNIVIAGNSAVSSDSVMALLQSSVLRDHSFWKSLLGINNILIWPRTIATSDLAFIPQLASVGITKDYFSRTVTANVTERAPYGTWCFVSGSSGATDTGAATQAPSSTVPENENCYSFDDQGVLFQRTFDTEGGAMSSIHDYSQKDRVWTAQSCPRNSYRTSFPL